MKALILVGGKGTRLKPYTITIPKPLLPVGDRPILEIILAQLKNCGITEIILAVGHMSHLFESFFQDGRRHGLKISYSYEEESLGTAGAIASSLDKLDGDFLAMNGDLLTTLNYNKMIDFHRNKKAGGTIAMYKREVKMDFGVIETNTEGLLDSYVEKPSFFYNFGMGVNVLNSEIVSCLVKEGEYLDMPDLMLLIKKEGHDVFCYQEDCFWLDMGRPEDYEKATEAFEERKRDFLPN